MADVSEQKRIFALETEEATWVSNDSGISYILRFGKGETCCDSPWSDHGNLWVGMKLDPDVEERFCVIGAVYESNSKHLLGVWASDPGDGHVEYYVRDDLDSLFESDEDKVGKIKEDMENVTGVLSGEISRNYRDVLDDGSGTTREATYTPAENLTECAAVALFYEEKQAEKRKRDEQDDTKNKKSTVEDE